MAAWRMWTSRICVRTMRAPCGHGATRWRPGCRRRGKSLGESRASVRCVPIACTWLVAPWVSSMAGSPCTRYWRNRASARARMSWISRRTWRIRGGATTSTAPDGPAGGSAAGRQLQQLVGFVQRQPDHAAVAARQMRDEQGGLALYDVGAGLAQRLPAGAIPGDFLFRQRLEADLG